MYGIWVSIPLWRPRSARCSRWCIAAIESTKLYGTLTLDTILERVAYSLNLLFHGRDETGAEICDKQVFCLTELKGDWEWHKLVFQFQASWVSKSHVCFKCEAQARSDDPDALFYNLDGRWRPYDLVTFLEQQLGRRRRTCCLEASVNAFLVARGPLVLIHGFHPQMLEICSMHTLNLGIAFNMNGASMSLAQHLSGASVWWQRFFFFFFFKKMLQGPPAPHQVLYRRDVGSGLRRSL